MTSYTESAINTHTPLNVPRRNDEDIISISTNNWEIEQATPYVLQNQSLMQQIAQLSATHTRGISYSPKTEQLIANV
ncbi:MAG: prevent-host-death protein [Cyanobacteria bacterium J06642_2]